MGRVSGKVALITGAAAGLGRADAIALVREGARVCITDVNASAGEALASELNRINADSAHFIRHDVREEEQWIGAIAEVKRHFGGLHVLVNNAGVVVMGTPETTTLDQFRLQQSVMSEGVFLGCKHAIPVLRDGGGGSIINMSSIASHLAPCTPTWWRPRRRNSVSPSARSSRCRAASASRKTWRTWCSSLHPTNHVL